jgi:hypothetical protein
MDKTELFMWDGHYRRDGAAIAAVLGDVLRSPNELDSNFEIANVVDGMFSISRALHHVARAIEGKEAE